MTRHTLPAPDPHGFCWACPYYHPHGGCMADPTMVCAPEDNPRNHPHADKGRKERIRELASER
jgi:hypothetical protein